MIVSINKMQLFRVFVVVSIAWFLLLVACSIERLAGGSAGETGNPVVTGVLFDNDGNPISNAVVFALPEGYDPMLGKNSTVIAGDTTDEYGKYRIILHARGFYNIQAVQILSRTRVLITHQAVQNDTTIAASGTLSKPGIVKVFLPEGFNRSRGYVYLPGTIISAQPGEGDDFVMLDSVPAGTIPSINYGVLGGTTVSEIRYLVPVVSADTSTVTLPAWKYSARIILNTSASGAGITGSVTDFPVLIRLRASTIDFFKAKADGSDVRFTKDDGLSLPYEIERWDAVNQQAEIWVKTDTIYGNNSTQTITMYWGNSVAADNSNGSAVFDTGRGFTGVWHLSDAPSGSVSIKDQTANHYHGTPLGGFSAADLVDGTIGKGLHFNGTDDIIHIGPQVKKGPVITFEAWVLTTLSESQRFIHDQNGYSLWYDQNCGLRMEFRDKTTAWRGIPQDGGIAQPLTMGTWCYVAGTFDGKKVRLYVNGALATASDSIAALPSTLTNTDSLVIGGWSGGHVKGVLDEVRMQNTPRSNDWIKLCYMNQKEQDALIQW